ncbi:MAG: PGF-CTERM sorting domain-containing protein [Halobacteria archaeon]
MTITTKLIIVLTLSLPVVCLANSGFIEYTNSNYVRDIRVIQNYSVAEYGPIGTFSLDFSPSTSKLLHSFSHDNGYSLRIIDLLEGHVREILRRPDPYTSQNYTAGTFARAFFITEDLIVVDYKQMLPGNFSLWTLNLTSWEFKQLLNESPTPTARISSQILAFEEDEVWLVSPNGDVKILFSNNVALGARPTASGDRLLLDYGDGRGNYSVWISDLDGKNKRQLIAYPQSATTGHWTRDGRIYFMTEPNPQGPFDFRNLMVKPDEASEPVQVTRFPFQIYDLRVTPDGGRAALLADIITPSGYIDRSHILLLELKPNQTKPAPPQPGFELAIALAALLGARLIYHRQRPQ